MMERGKMHSADLAQDNLAQLQAWFPGCVPRPPAPMAALRWRDIDQLRQEFSASSVKGPQERFHLDWPGKRAVLPRRRRLRT